MALLVGSAAWVVADSPARFVCEPWPEADALFKRDPIWRGGDGVASLDLGAGRVLWLFGDTFIGKAGDPRRAGSQMIRNSVAIQQGYDPTTASFGAYWDTSGELAADFFPQTGEEWLWPGHGAVIDGELILFFMRVKKKVDWPKFEVVGWTSRVVENHAEPPSAWRYRDPRLPACASTGEMNLAASALIEGDRLCVFGTFPTITHPAILLGWPLESVRRDDLSAPDYWDVAACEWIPLEDGALPEPVFNNSQEEYSVHRSERLGFYLQVQMKGFPQGRVAVRHADDLRSAWSEPLAVHTPEENSWDEMVFTYSAKAHPEQSGDALALTYCTNTTNGLQVFSDDKLYYPRFLKLTTRSATAEAGGGAP